MAPEVHEAKCVLFCHKTKPLTTVQNRFQTEFGREPSAEMCSWKFYKLTTEAFCIHTGKSCRKGPPVTEVREAFVRSRRKPNRQATRHEECHNRVRAKFCKFVWGLTLTNTCQLLQYVTYPSTSSHLWLWPSLKYSRRFTDRKLFSNEATCPTLRTFPQIWRSIWSRNIFHSVSEDKGRVRSSRSLVVYRNEKKETFWVFNIKR